MSPHMDKAIDEMEAEIERLRGLLRETLDCALGRVTSPRLLADIARRAEEALDTLDSNRLL